LTEDRWAELRKLCADMGVKLTIVKADANVPTRIQLGGRPMPPGGTQGAR
jgi:hypothetical protein